jgi:hypothetical protein
MSKSLTLKSILVLCALYFFVAALAHFFGLTIFPFYDSALYSPYHDTLLALCDIIFFLFFAAAAINPTKNKTIITIIIAGFVLAFLTNIWIIWKIDWVHLPANTKLLQTKVEAALAAATATALFVLRPRT